MYVCVYCSKVESYLHMQKQSCHLTESFRVLYNVKLDDKCEIELKNLCRNTGHLFLGHEY